jgi:hypothetical protein
LQILLLLVGEGLLLPPGEGARPLEEEGAYPPVGEDGVEVRVKVKVEDVVALIPVAGASFSVCINISMLVDLVHADSFRSSVPVILLRHGSTMATSRRRLLG